MRTSLKSLVAIACTFSSVLTAASVELKRTAHQIDITIGGRPFTTYYFTDAVAKPYLMPLRTASGIVISRNFPVANTVTAADAKTPSFEPHQRPLYFGHGDIDGLNFWAEQPFDKYYHGESHEAYGHLSFTKLETAAAGSLRAKFNLLAPSSRVIAEEIQTFQFQGDDQTRTIDCEFVVLANPRPGHLWRHQRRYFRHTLRTGTQRARRSHAQFQWRSR